jgi:hypothetical protein
MCCGLFKAFGGLGAIVALVLLVVALLKQLIVLVGFLLTLVKVAIVVIFIAVLDGRQMHETTTSCTPLHASFALRTTRGLYSHQSPSGFSHVNSN